MLLQNIRAKIGARLSGKSEEGFTLIELLVVMLILGILAAIALPAFFNQKSKATDSKAKETAHSAEVAMETCATESSSGSYEKCNLTALRAIEPTLPSVETGKVGTEYIKLTPKAAEYTIAVTSTGGNVFQVIRGAKGELTFKCEKGKESTSQGGCPTGGNWGQ